MLSKYDAFYDIIDTFESHDRRFVKPSQKFSVDSKAMEEFFAYAPSLPEGPWGEDLKRDLVVKYLLQPRYSPGFQRVILRNTPVDHATTHYRQEGVRELVEKPDLAKRVEDALASVVDYNDKFQGRHSVMVALRGSYHSGNINRGGVLREITPHNLRVLAQYVQATKQLADTLKDAESRPLRRLYSFLREEIQGNDFFRDISPVFEISYFKDDRVSLDVTIARDGSYRAAIVHRKADGSIVKDVGRALARVPARLWGFLHTWQLPSTYAMDSINTLVESHFKELMRLSSVVGPVEFYTSMAGFHRRMKKANLPICFPCVYPKEERRLFLPDARNPLLLYAQKEDGEVVNVNKGKVVGSDLSYDPTQNMVLISGPNQAGKSVFIRTLGVLAVLGLNGGPVTSDEGAFLSVLDRISTHFAGEDDLMKGEGTLLRELRRYHKNVFRNITPYSLALLDEPTTGTDFNGSRVLLTRILNRHHQIGAATFVATHHHEMGDLVDDGTFYCGYTLCPEVVRDLETGRIRKTYKIIPGRSDTSLAEDVADQTNMNEDDLERLISERISAGELDLKMFRTRK